MLTVNQILVICLILVLVAFVVVMAIMAKHAIELMKKTKVLVGDGQELLDDTKEKVTTAEDKIINAAVSVAADTSPAVKALSTAAGGLTTINLVSMIGRGLVKRGGFVAAMADRRERKKTRKELKKSRKMIKKVPKIIKNTLQSSVSISAAADTTPFPPLKWKKTGNECPSMQNIPATYFPQFVISVGKTPCDAYCEAIKEKI